MDTILSNVHCLLSFNQMFMLILPYRIGLFQWSLFLYYCFTRLAVHIRSTKCPVRINNSYRFKWKCVCNSLTQKYNSIKRIGIETKEDPKKYPLYQWIGCAMKSDSLKVEYRIIVLRFLRHRSKSVPKIKRHFAYIIRSLSTMTHIVILSIKNIRWYLILRDYSAE